LPARIAFQVASRTDSRVVLDEMGADKLLGNGDMLFLLPGTSTLLRGQGTYLSDDEITRVVDFVGTDDPQFAGELMQLKTKDEAEAGGGTGFKNRDELYEAAVDIVVRERRGSVSLLQRALGIGYGRGARLIDFMAEDGIVGEYNGSQAREVLISLEEWETMSRSGDAGAAKPVGDAGPAVGAIAPRYVTVGAVGAATAVAAASGATNAMTTAGAASTRSPRRNKIVPEPDEPSDLEDELEAEESEADDDSIPFDADAGDDAWEEVDEDEDGEWDEEPGDGETALVVGRTAEESVSGEEDFEDDEVEEDEVEASEDDAGDEWEEAEDEWEEDEELSKK
jgi:S-DNA-T family DNA segregation ATPase FtsK/SpoIIIE